MKNLKKYEEFINEEKHDNIVMDNIRKINKTIAKHTKSINNLRMRDQLDNTGDVLYDFADELSLMLNMDPNDEILNRKLRYWLDNYYNNDASKEDLFNIIKNSI